MSRACRRFQRPIALLAHGDLGRRRAARLQRHLAYCAGCRELRHEMTGLEQVAAALRLDDAETDALFVPVGNAVRARLAARQAPAAAPAPGMWGVLAPVAATLVVGAVLLVGRSGQEARMTPAAVTTTTTAASINVSPGEDASDTILTLDPTPGRVHRVAVSRQSADFRHAQVYEVEGGRWVDSTPLPEPGQIVFYRID